MELNFPLLLDGATGTELQKRGFTGDVSTEEWVLTHPEAMIDLQRGYIEAGSQIVYAPTFGANRTKLEEHGVFNQTAEYNRRLVEISKEAAGGKAWVAGDIAPTGKMLYPLGDVRFEELVDVYTEQARAMEAAGVDLFVIETMMTLAEARAAVLAVKSVSTKPVFVTFTAEANGRSMTGTDIVAVCEVMQGMGVDAFGMNCSVGPDIMLEQVRRLHEVSRVPLIAKPNAGLPVVKDGKTEYLVGPDAFAKFIPQLAAAGVEIFGGCCGTTKEHVAAMHEALAGTAMHAPDPKHTDKLPAVTGTDAFYLVPDTDYDHVLRADDTLGDQLEEEGESASPLTAIAIEKEEDLANFEDEQVKIKKPLCLVTDDAVLLGKALRLYQGRALYDGNLKNDELVPLVQKYGVLR